MLTLLNFFNSLQESWSEQELGREMGDEETGEEGSSGGRLSGLWRAIKSVPSVVYETGSMVAPLTLRYFLADETEHPHCQQVMLCEMNVRVKERFGKPGEIAMQLARSLVLHLLFLFLLLSFIIQSIISISVNPVAYRLDKSSLAGCFLLLSEPQTAWDEPISHQLTECWICSSMAGYAMGGNDAQRYDSLVDAARNGRRGKECTELYPKCVARSEGGQLPAMLRLASRLINKKQ